VSDSRIAERADGRDAQQETRSLAVRSGGTRLRSAVTSTAGARKEAAALALSVVPSQRAITSIGPLPAGIPIKRDAVFRRLLAMADLAAAAGSLAVLAGVTGHPIRVTSVLTIPLIVLIAKVAGRYDHDAVVLRKSTLDEIPRLLSLAGAYALAWSFVTAVTGAQSSGGGVIILWASTAALLVSARATARALGQLSAPLERVLIVGESLSRQTLAHALRADPAARLEVVGFLPLEDERRSESNWNGRSRRRRQVTFEDVARWSGRWMYIACC
jgi:hypothetical protein